MLTVPVLCREPASKNGVQTERRPDWRLEPVAVGAHREWIALARVEVHPEGAPEVRAVTGLGRHGETGLTRERVARGERVVEHAIAALDHRLGAELVGRRETRHPHGLTLPRRT